MTTATLQIAADPAPLEVLPDGRVVAAGTGVRYYIFLRGYLRGDTPEELEDAFADLSLADVYRLIGYYLTHRDQVDAWLAQIDREEQEAIAAWEAKFPPQIGLRGRLEKRLAELRASNPD